MILMSAMIMGGAVLSVEAEEDHAASDEATREYEDGTRLFEAGRYQEAAEVFQRAAWLLQQARAGGRTPAIQDALRLSRWHTEQAKDALQRHEPVQALVHAERAAELDPTNRLAKRLINQAQTAYDAQKKQVEERRTLLGDATRADQSGRAERAVELWQRAHRLYPADAGIAQALKAAQARLAQKQPQIIRATALEDTPRETRPLLAEYLLSPGDVVEVFVYQQPDLTRDVIVRPDGRISFPLVGDLQAVGLSLTQLHGTLTERLKTYIRFPDVSLAVKRFGGSKTIVMGEVGRVGIYVPLGEGRLLDVIAMAGGFSPHAVTSNVMVIRGGLVAPQIIKVDVPRIFSKGALEENIRLQPDDIVFVPKSLIASTMDFMTQFQPALSELLLAQSIATNFGTRETSGGITR